MLGLLFLFAEQFSIKQTHTHTHTHTQNSACQMCVCYHHIWMNDIRARAGAFATKPSPSSWLICMKTLHVGICLQYIHRLNSCSIWIECCCRCCCCYCWWCTRAIQKMRSRVAVGGVRGARPNATILKLGEYGVADIIHFGVNRCLISTAVCYTNASFTLSLSLSQSPYRTTARFDCMRSIPGDSASHILSLLFDSPTLCESEKGRDGFTHR